MPPSGALITRRHFCGAAACAFIAPAAFAADDRAAQLMDASYRSNRFDQARFTATLSLRSGSGGQTRRALTGWAKLIGSTAQARLIRFSSPADFAGVATLTVERGAEADDLWIYLPAMRKVRRLVTANRADPWVGSDFSFGDILGHKVSDWTHKLDGAARQADADAWLITSLPASAAIARETGYGMRRSWVRKSDNALLRCDFYTPARELLKSAVCSDFRVFDGETGKAQPMVMAMHNARRNSTSVLRFDRFAIDAQVSARDVAPQSLQG